MDYEKAYKAVVQRAKELHKNGNALTKQQMEIVFPELAESEDDRKRKNCIHFLELQKKYHADTSEIDDCIDYLEKQKEQKPVISNEAIREGIAHFGITQYQIDNWLKKHINVVEQKPAEGKYYFLDCGTTAGVWSENEKTVQLIKKVLYDSKNGVEHMIGDTDYYKCVDWLKSLRPQSHWKPTDEQMDALRSKLPTIMGTGNYVDSLLESLYNDLKKLM